MMSSNSVLIKQVFLVTPAKSTPTHVLKLSTIDSQLMLRFPSDYLFIYNPPSGYDRSIISSSFRAALAEVLISYYPLSGRVRESLDGSGLEVVCRSQGVFFVEAISNCYSMADFEKSPRFIGEWRGFMSFYVKDILNGPPLVVQLTWLKDGAMVIGVGIYHCICDGMGSVEFLNSFAKLAAAKLGRVVEFKSIPIWDRHLLTPQSQLCNRQNPLPLSAQEFHPVPDVSKFMSRFSNEPLIPTAVTFEKTNILTLKSLANHVSKFTTFEVLTAHIWQSWAKSLKLPPNQTLKLLFSINVRNIIKPNLPTGYYGNAIVLCCAKTTAGELANKNLGYAASLVKKAKERIENDHVRHVIELLNKSKAVPDLVGVLIVTQWSRLGLEKVDFGMGRPVHVGPICSDRHCYLLPVSNEVDAVKAMVAVPASAVEEYESLIRNVAT